MKKLLLSALILSAIKGNAQLCFSSPTNYTLSVGTYPQDILSADFNGDNKKDLATSNGSSNTISILLGTGTGTFGAATNFSVGSDPIAITCGDFNGDLKSDLVTANKNSNNISLLLGTGTGSFSAATSFSVGLSPIDLICKDFNGDSKADLAILFGNYTHDSISVLLGNGTGSFGTPIKFPSGGSLPTSIYSDDFNNDSKQDLITTNGDSNNVSLYLGLGTGHFASSAYFLVGQYPWQATSGDFNSDSKLDLLTANPNSNDASLLLGNGVGSFGTATNFFTGCSIPYYVISADYDGDMKLDLAIRNGAFYVALGDGAGNFATGVNFPAGSNPGPIINDDFNADGKIDVAMANQSSTNVTVLLNCSSVGIKSFINQKDIFIYPNPTSDQFFIATNTTDKLTVDMYDVNGRHVFSTNVSDKEHINVATLDNGAYTLTIKTADRVINKKVVILR